jgi:4-nitrophenyl phosphatase/NagD protein
MLYNVSKRRPLVIGKPEPLMPSLAMDKWGIDAAHTLVIGDRIYTDIKSGLRAGTHTALVLSGETTREILEASEEKPEVVLESAAEILRRLK